MVIHEERRETYDYALEWVGSWVGFRVAFGSKILIGAGRAIYVRVELGLVFYFQIRVKNLVTRPDPPMTRPAWGSGLTTQNPTQPNPFRSYYTMQ